MSSRIICRICGKPIKIGEDSIAWDENQDPAHFDCAYADENNNEESSNNEKMLRV